MGGHNAPDSLAIQHRAADAFAATPGVTAAGFASKIPLSLSTPDRGVWRDGVTDFRESNMAVDGNRYDLSPGYLAAGSPPTGHSRLQSRPLRAR